MNGKRFITRVRPLECTFRPVCIIIYSHKTSFLSPKHFMYDRSCRKFRKGKRKKGVEINCSFLMMYARQKDEKVPISSAQASCISNDSIVYCDTDHRRDLICLSNRSCQFTRKTRLIVYENKLSEKVSILRFSLMDSLSYAQPLVLLAI